MPAQFTSASNPTHKMPIGASKCPPQKPTQFWANGNKVEKSFGGAHFLLGVGPKRDATAILAYKNNPTCEDKIRDDPWQAFGPSFEAAMGFPFWTVGDVAIDIGACYGDTTVPIGLRAKTVIV